MIKEIRFSEEFDRAFKRLKKRYRSLPDDVKKLLASLLENPQQGVELYNGMRNPTINLQQIRHEILSHGNHRKHRKLSSASPHPCARHPALDLWSLATAGTQEG